MVDANKPTLGYWKIRGLAQACRIQLAHAGVDFEDKMYEVHVKAEGGFDTSEWTDAKATMTGFPNLPYIKVGDFCISEAVAVHRYIASKYNPATLGSTPQIAGVADQVYSVLHALRFNKCTMGCYTHGDREKIMADCKADLDKFAAHMADGKHYLAGNELTWVDFIGYEAVEVFQWVSEGKFFDMYPCFKEYHARIAAEPKVAAFLEAQAPLPWNNKMAKLNA